MNKEQPLYTVFGASVSKLDNWDVPVKIRTSLNLQKITESFNILKEKYNGVEVPSEEIKPLRWHTSRENILEAMKTPDGDMYCLIRSYIEA